MGIKNLNVFLREKCEYCTSINHISWLSDKKIAVDISIYLYKYKTEHTLIESFYTLLSLFKEYNIIAVFIFDGKPPEEKKNVLSLRQNIKIKINDDLNDLTILLKNTTNIIKRYDIEQQINILKKKTTTITKYDIINVKKLIRCFGLNYYDAFGEADELCAYLVTSGKVFAVLSEDMDMFVYGCNYVLRYFNLIHQNFILYDFQKILTTLNLTQQEFSCMCILSGTDYSLEYEYSNNILNIYNEFVKNKNLMICCYEKNKSVQLVYNKFFNLSNENLKLYNNIIISNNFNNKILYKSMQSILEGDGFVFPKI